MASSRTLLRAPTSAPAQHPPLMYISSPPSLFPPLPPEGGYAARPTSTPAREFPINSLIKVDRLARRKRVECGVWRVGSTRKWHSRFALGI